MAEAEVKVCRGRFSKIFKQEADSNGIQCKGQGAGSARVPTQKRSRQSSVIR